MLMYSFFFFDLYSATSTKYGINEFGPPFFDGTYPDIVLAGPNVGSNTGVIDALSGTVYVLVTFFNSSSSWVISPRVPNLFSNLYLFFVHVGEQHLQPRVSTESPPSPSQAVSARKQASQPSAHPQTPQPPQTSTPP